MRLSFSTSLLSKAGSPEPIPRGAQSVWLYATCCGLLIFAMGCEAMQRKFTRKAKRPAEPPTPMIHFQDYTRTMTPLDRYRKHYLMFDYWNSQLIEALQSQPLNPKRYRRASAEAMAEIEALRDLVTDEVAQRVAPLIEARLKMHRQLHTGAFSPSQAPIICQMLEQQTRRIHRQLYWRDVEDHLKGPMALKGPPSQTAQSATSVTTP